MRRAREASEKKKAISPDPNPGNREAPDRVKYGTKELYVGCTDVRSGLKKIKVEHRNEVVVVPESSSVPVSECMSVVAEMQRIARDLHGLLFTDANKVTK